MYKWVYILLTFSPFFSRAAQSRYTIFLITHSSHNLASHNAAAGGALTGNRSVGTYFPGELGEDSCTTVVLHCLSLYFVLILIMIYRCRCMSTFMYYGVWTGGGSMFVFSLRGMHTIANVLSKHEEYSMYRYISKNKK